MSPGLSNRFIPPYVTAARDFDRNEPQKRAYDSQGHCAVLAGPGSGKTKVLTAKIARLLAEDVKEPRGIACVTYSSECARELVRRLGRLGVRSSNNLFIGTVHSFCLKNVVIP
jgi:DNA helicase II / ATP-dependent DNA helicase PcrA